MTFELHLQCHVRFVPNSDPDHEYVAEAAYGEQWTEACAASTPHHALQGLYDATVDAFSEPGSVQPVIHLHVVGFDA